MKKLWFLYLFLLLSTSIWGQTEDRERYLIEGRRENPDPMERGGDLQIIDHEQIQAKAPRDMGELLDTIPGLQVTRTGGLGQSVFLSIRGSSAEQVLVLINGSRLNTAQGGGVDLASLDMDRVERIEIFKGAAGAVFGESAMGGVINIILKENTSQESQWQVRAGYGAYQSWNLDLSQEDSPGDFHYSWSGSLEGSQGDFQYDSGNGDSETRDNSQSLKAALQMNMGYQWNDRLKVSSTGWYSYFQRGVPGMEEFPSPEGEMADQSFFSNLGMLLQTQQGLWEAESSFLQQIREYEDPGFPLGAIEDRHLNRSLEGRLEYQHFFTPKSFDLNMRMAWSGRWDWLDSTALTQDNGSSSDGRVQRMQHSLWAVQHWSFFEDPQRKYPPMAMFPSFRMDWNTPKAGDEALHYSWNLGLNWIPGEQQKWMIKLNGGRTYRIPSMDDLYWSSTAFAVGNPDLLPEWGYSMDMGITYHFTDSLSWENSAFYSRMEQLILWTPGPNGQWRPDNLARAVLWGGESLISWTVDMPNLSAFLDIQGGGGFLRALNDTPGDINQGNYLPRRVLEQASLTLLYQHYQGHSLLVEGVFMGNRYSNVANTKLMDPYFLLNSSVSWKMGKSWVLNLNLQNLLNQPYRDLQEYPLPGIQGGIEIQWQL